MARYIDKAAVVAEIDERIASLEGIGSENYLHDNYPEQYAMLVTLKSLKFSIDTLEVKEVDLDTVMEEEYNKCRCYNSNGSMLITLNRLQFNSIAKHFFELGLKAKGE